MKETDSSEQLTSEARRLAQSHRRSATWILGGAVLLLLLILVALQSFGVWELISPDTASETLSLYTLSTFVFAAFFIFTFVFLRTLLKLRRERRASQLGSKIKTRLVVSFIAVSLLPIAAMAVFSYVFLNRSLEKWFSRLPEDVVNEARRERYNDSVQRQNDLDRTARLLALKIGDGTEFLPDLDQLVKQSDLDALFIFDRDANPTLRIVPYTTENQSQNPARVELSNRLESAARRALMNAERAAAMSESTSDEKSQTLVAAVPVPQGRLIVLRTEARSEHLERIIAGSEIYDRLRGKQQKVRLQGLSIIGLITLLLLYAATWTALNLARSIATPIKALAEASGEVARGNLAYRVETTGGDDELELLAQAFNDMTGQLAANREQIERATSELRDKNMALEERRNYIETVLRSLSTGVISLDEQDRVTTINAAATAMLYPGETTLPGTPVGELLSPATHNIFTRILRRARRAGRAAEQIDLARRHQNETHESDTIPVALTAIALDTLIAPEETRGSGNEVGADGNDAPGRGVVLVIEDLSDLLAAQRAAAWGEVARRMAHEIKNPLTPIQLSAERIRRSFTRLAERENITSLDSPMEHARVGRIVEEGTTTIVREVASLKSMVDEFSRFARLPQPRLEPNDLNQIIQQAVKLYEERLSGVQLEVRLAHELPVAHLDGEQMRRVFVNLIDNALESVLEMRNDKYDQNVALSDGDATQNARIRIATAYDPSRALLLAEVTDTGHGIKQSDRERVFQPNFSTRGRGTGLGLAIVQRIISDHNGQIRHAANHPHGAKFMIEIPVADEVRQTHDATQQSQTARYEDAPVS